MVSKCANPACPTPFRYMRDGKLFRIEFDPERESLVPHLVGEPKAVRRIEYFWLCGPCSSVLTLAVDNGAMKVVPIEGLAMKRAAGS